MSFDHLKKLSVQSGKPAEFTFFEIDGEPTLMVLPATEANRAYFNAFLKRARRLTRGREVTTETMSQTRNDDRILYPETVIKGWKNVKDDQGQEAPFTKENADAFVKALPDWLFDKLREFCINPTNFTQIDPEASAGN